MLFKFWVVPLQFKPSSHRPKLPLHFDSFFVALRFPGQKFFFDSFLSGGSGLEL